MRKFVDITGKKFNKVTAITYIGNGVWECRCDCGISIRRNRSKLEGGLKGCRRCIMCLPEGEASFNEVYGNYQRHAVQAEREFLLSKPEAKELFQKTCAYCGSSPNNCYKGKVSSYIYNGIDRIDNAKGYFLKNCISCCKLCNYMKHVLTKEQFLEHVLKIVNYQVISA